ncbi:hypothetical protein SteCoe_29877 [Stentor coeruleus]|uniref:P2X purinoceptor n=1 Tax=Stentor coeruleus TaxID=5963 RepID=A0A1R2B4Z3_9CILI|nr:hypothetical protein SteCoe_29877 [Stentor coeruleus]
MDNDEEIESRPLVQTEEIKQEEPAWYSWNEIKLRLKEYQTSKDVRILDRRLGYIYYSSLFIIIVYLVVVVFMINQSYLDKEKVEGIAYSTLLGLAYSTGDNAYVWDVPEENPWGHETSAVFIPSKILVTRGQYQGLCADPLLYCEIDEDCSPVDLPNVIEGRKCLDTPEGTKGCIAWRWCPPENSLSTKIYYLENAAHQMIWSRIKVKFERLATLSKDTLGSSSIEKFPGSNSNAWEISDIILMAGTNFSDITDKGAIFKATIVLQCIANPSEICDTKLEVTRLDSVDSGGYSMTHGEYYRQGDILYRDLYHMKGVRILFDVLGIYISSSLFNIVLQIASALGLIIASNAITDAVMLNILKEKSHFKMLKIKESEDFNEE